MITISLEEAMPIGSVWAYKLHRTLVVHTVIAHDEGKAIVRSEDITAAGTIYRAVDEHEYSTWESKMYERTS